MPFCPKCRDEFENWVQICPDCHVKLVAKLPLAPPAAKLPPAHDNRDNIVTIASSRHPEEAYIMSEKLKAAGIQAFVADENMTGMYGMPPLSTWGTRVQVFESDAAEAVRLLGLLKKHY